MWPIYHYCDDPKFSTTLCHPIIYTYHFLPVASRGGRPFYYCLMFLGHGSKSTTFWVDSPLTFSHLSLNIPRFNILTVRNDAPRENPALMITSSPSYYIQSHMLFAIHWLYLKFVFLCLLISNKLLFQIKNNFLLYSKPHLQLILMKPFYP